MKKLKNLFDFKKFEITKKQAAKLKGGTGGNDASEGIVTEEVADT